MNAQDIARERLALWEKKLAAVNATPMLLIGVWHGTTSGEIIVLSVDGEEVSDDALIAFLRSAANYLQRRRQRAVQAYEEAGLRKKRHAFRVAREREARKAGAK